MFRVNNKDTNQNDALGQCRRSGIFIVNFEHVIAGWEIAKIPELPLIAALENFRNNDRIVALVRSQVKYMRKQFQLNFTK